MERMSRRRRQRSVELVKTCITSPFGLYRIWKTFAVPLKPVSSMAAQRPICISHLLAGFHTNPYNCIHNGLLPYKV